MKRIKHYLLLAAHTAEHPMHLAYFGLVGFQSEHTYAYVALGLLAVGIVSLLQGEPPHV